VALKTHKNLAQGFIAAGRAAEADALHEGTVMLRESKIGPNRPQTLVACGNLAFAYETAGRFSDTDNLRPSTLNRRRQVETADTRVLARDLIVVGGNRSVRCRSPNDTDG
jgi:hypothetical protein